MSTTVTIERMGYGAAAIGHMENGKTVFVEGGAPEDVCEIRITDEKPSFAVAELVNIVKPSSLRAKLDPKYTVSGCIPGAPWAHLEYSAQLHAKRCNLVEALVRVGKLDRQYVEKTVSECVPSKREWGYRNKIELSAFTNEAGKFTLGMHEAGSQDIVDVPRTPLANRFLEGAPKSLTGAIRFLQGADDLGIYRVGVRASLRTKSTEIALWTAPAAFPRTAVAKTLQDALRATSVVRVVAEPGAARKVKKVETLEGAGFWKEELAGTSFAISAPSFFQVNTAQAEKLVELVMAELNLEGDELVADLYSGAGTFSLPIAQTGADVVAIELEGSSVRDLRRNAQYNNCDIEIIGDDVARALPEIGVVDAAVVDPPRSGLSKEVIAAIANAAPKRLAYVSCDPQTFARDTAALHRRGFTLETATPVDMFPQTYHQETVGIFKAS
ncbi:23S rRNA (uracil(1939)-C(5))-methyltransferase RlmD [Adlercreutzia sp. ZJ154]|uniref:23S rRNA (uracil(1939)-C(5))-methyltransferase RlmD n=1 Tax=Adlercreutzia sp. ZJ154 TaxID=2709790 RepID=UPI0013EC1713|nr:23S rRNA (uracil(1939)-C(5))-methyltransferase RlmD [Adlercreutzia sp. ZJ154]